MYFSKITLKPNVNTMDFIHNVCGNSYKEHQVLWKLFNDDPTAQRDFIYRYEPHNNNPSYYIVSKREPRDLDSIWDIRTKPYTPHLLAGQRFSFLLRVNPVKTKDGKRHDIVMYEKHRIDYKNLKEDKRPAHQAVIEKAGSAWITSREKQYGFSVDEAAMVIDGYQTHVSSYKKGNKIRYSTLDYRGILTVTEVVGFEKVLMEGIGKAKAFGCGLMLIRRV